MPLNDLQKAFLKDYLIPKDQIIDPDTEEPLDWDALVPELNGIEDVPGLQAALDAKASSDDLADYVVDPTTMAGDLIYMSGAENVGLLSAGGTATASATGDSCLPDYAFNDVEGTNSFQTNGWRSSNSTPGHWLRRDLGSAKSIASVRVLLGTDVNRQFQSYQVQYSDNDSDWTTVATQSTYAVDATHVFAQTESHRYWRLLFGGGSGFGCDVIEWDLITAAAITRLPSTAFGRSLLSAANAAAARALLEIE